MFAFASEIKSLLEHPAISPAVEHELLPEYLAFGYNAEERTLSRHSPVIARPSPDTGHIGLPPVIADSTVLGCT